MRRELAKGKTYRLTASSWAPGVQGAFWIAVTGPGVKLTAVPFKVPTAEEAAAMQVVCCRVCLLALLLALLLGLFFGLFCRCGLYAAGCVYLLYFLVLLLGLLPALLWMRYRIRASLAFAASSVCEKSTGAIHQATMAPLV